MRKGLILAEVELFRFATERVFGEFLAAFGAEIEPQRLINVISDIGVGVVFEAFEDIVNFDEIVAIIIQAFGHFIKGGKHFNLHHVSQIMFGLYFTLAEIAAIVNHRLVFLAERIWPSRLDNRVEEYHNNFILMTQVVVRQPEFGDFFAINYYFYFEQNSCFPRLTLA